MTRTVEIDPVTRIEGHARVYIDIDDSGNVENAGMVVNELRGFERILVGMDASQMPLITARICGVCPTSHHLAGAKALDAATQTPPPIAGTLLRELMFMGHYIHSHALSLFVLQGPDLVLGLDGPAEKRNIVGVVEAVPDIATKALRLRTIGQKINELVGGRGVHPVTAIAGGMSWSPSESDVNKLRNMSDEALKLVEELAPVARELLLTQVSAHPDLLNSWHSPTHYMGTVKDGFLNLYDGELVVVNAKGDEVTRFDTPAYTEHLQETVLDWSYMKPVGLRTGNQLQTYRVGPLARIKCAKKISTPMANALLGEMTDAFGNSDATVLYTYARLIELVYACEQARIISNDKRLFERSRDKAVPLAGRGIAHVEAPRGTLIHDYEIDKDNIVRKANLLVATQQNYNGINESITQAAQSHVAGKGDDGLLNAIEFAIRCYDPCLSCATHAVGQMPIEIVMRTNGVTQRVLRRTSLD